MSTRLAWIVMELPAPVLFLAVYLDGGAASRVVPLLFLAMWQGHYLHRTFVYPFRVPGPRPEDAAAGWSGRAFSSMR